jgi:hypothetical protein
MTSKRPDAEFEAMMKLTDLRKRYGYCVKKIADGGALYWLEGPEGRCVLGPDEKGRMMLPIWPSAAFAAAYVERDEVARVEWAGCEPVEIEVHEFLEEHVPGLIEDGYLIAAFAIPPGNAAVVEAAEFAGHLEYELGQVE